MTKPVSDLLQNRFSQLKSQRSRSIELMSVTKAFTNNNSIERKSAKKFSMPEQEYIPDCIDELIDNKMYRNKFKKLIREGYEPQLLQLAELAKKSATKETPSHWFNRATRTTPIKGREHEQTLWQRSLAYLDKLKEHAKKAAYVAQKLGTEVTLFIHKQIWKGINVVRYADLAVESGRNPRKLFTWYCMNPDKIA